MTITETTAAMTPPTEPAAAPSTGAPSTGAPGTGDTGAQSASVPAPAAVSARPGSTKRSGHRTVSPNVVISVLGGFIAVLLTALCTLMVMQFNSLGQRIDNLGTELRAEIDSLGTELRAETTELRAEIAALRAEMREEFREVHAILLDHTDRLARLETAAGLPRPPNEVSP